MNQYIITEEELDIIHHDCIHESEEGCPDDCIYADSDSGCNLHTQDFVAKVRSHPYQSERDKVLDELLEFINGQFGFGVYQLREKIEELRQQVGDRV
jgi:hypothetical protein